MKDNFVTVVAPIENSPGIKAGILAGDRITRINGTNLTTTVLGDVVKILRGEPDTEITITISRPSTGIVKDFTLKRAIITVEMVKDINGRKEFTLGENKIGYVHLVQFGEKTSGDLETALKKLKEQGMKALILDLRWNPGGLLEQAVKVCEKFLPSGQLVVSTEGRNPAQNDRHNARGRDVLVNRDGSQIPIVVLVNSSSASASEIVAGCLQDLHRAIILGEKTFGKGSVQSILPLDDGYALRLTTAKYYTPSHKVIHEVGISPNVTVPLTDEEERDVLLKRMPGGVESLDDKERERVQNSRDPQMDRATDLLKGILLFTERVPNKTTGKMAALEPAAK
jgi:carboxyl-terminal processing protease